MGSQDDLERLADAQREAAHLREEIDRSMASRSHSMGSGAGVRDTLASRLDDVSDLTQYYFRGDIVPPTTKSQILRAQKFAVIYYYLMNAVFFIYAFIIPCTNKPPYYGGFDLRNFHGGTAGKVIVCVVIALLLVRFLVMSWSAEFYHFAVLLAGLEIALVVFTAVFWSPGLPILLTLLFSNLLNIAVSQFYFKFQFTKVVQDLPSLVLPKMHGVSDSTVVSVFDPTTLYNEFRKLWGLKKTKTPAMLFDERCGVFSTKESVSHVEALHAAYMQALEPRSRWVPWRHVVYDLWNIGIFGLLDGMLNTFVTNAAVSFAGFWLGEVMFVDFYHGGWAILCAVAMLIIYFTSIHSILHWLEEALGVAVAEKEWLAHDVVKHSAQRDEMLFDVVDVMGTSPAKSHMLGPDFMQKGRLNLVFMWLCVACVSDFIGESFLGKLYHNCAHETRSMMEALTPYDFKLFPHAKWEVTSKGVIIKIVQTFILTFTCCLYFGTYFEKNPVPVPLVAVLGAACFLQSVVKLTEAVQFAFTILSVGSSSTHRHMWVSEWIVLVAFFFVLINVLIWLYLLPIMKNWDLPVGKCTEEFNQLLFPSACLGKY